MESSVFFESTSPSDASPSIITVSFAQDPTGTLGAQLKNLDTGEANELFNPAYATIERLVDGITIASTCGLRIGDCIVAVNGQGFRRFAPDYDDNKYQDELCTNLDGSMSISFDEEVVDETGKSKDDDEDISGQKRLKDRVIPSRMKKRTAFKALVRAITEIKAANDPNNPLVISIERYGWDSRVNSWPRFLQVKNNNVPDAMKMIQEHEQWKQTTFPIDLRRPGLNVILKSRAITGIAVESKIIPPTIYVDLGKLMKLEGTMSTSKDSLDAFIIKTELILSKSTNSVQPKVCHFIDLSETNMKDFNGSLLKEIYSTFQSNYPETLHKMVMYPATKTVCKTMHALLSFVEKETRDKFVFTDDISVVCLSFGWYVHEVYSSGGISEFIKEHQGDRVSLI